MNKSISDKSEHNIQMELTPLQVFFYRKIGFYLNIIERYNKVNT